MAEETIEKVEKKSKGKLVLVVVALVILLLAFAVAFIAGRFLFADKGEEMEEQYVLGPIFEVQEITVNIADTGGRRFLMAQFSIEVDQSKVLKEVEKKLPIIQDRLIMVLSAQSIEDLSAPNGMERVKSQLIDNLNEVLHTGEVTNIYYNRFVWQ